MIHVEDIEILKSNRFSSVAYLNKLYYDTMPRRFEKKYEVGYYKLYYDTIPRRLEKN